MVEDLGWEGLHEVFCLVVHISLSMVSLMEVIVLRWVKDEEVLCYWAGNRWR